MLLAKMLWASCPSKCGHQHQACVIAIGHWYRQRSTNRIHADVLAHSGHGHPHLLGKPGAHLYGWCQCGAAFTVRDGLQAPLSLCCCQLGIVFDPGPACQPLLPACLSCTPDNNVRALHIELSRHLGHMISGHWCMHQPAIAMLGC